MNKLQPLIQKSTLLFFLLILISSGAFAQYSFGLKGGVDFSNYGGQYLTDSYSGKTAASFGLVMQRQTNSWFSLQAELNYEGKGANYNYVTSSESYYTEEYKDFEEDLNYLTLPILAKFDMGEKKRVFGYAGLYFGYLMSATIQGTYIKTNNFNPEDQTIQEIDRDYKSDIIDFDMGAVFGIGADFSLSESLLLFVDGRFNWGWINVAQQGQGKIRNNVWSLNLGLVYHLPGNEDVKY